MRSCPVPAGSDLPGQAAFDANSPPVSQRHPAGVAGGVTHQTQNQGRRRRWRLFRPVRPTPGTRPGAGVRPFRTGPTGPLAALTSGCAPREAPARTADSFKTASACDGYGRGMTPRISLIGLTTSDLSASLAFYRKLGLDLPEGAEREPHVEVVLPGGLRLAWDTDEIARATYPDWAPARGGGRIALAFRCEDPADVDRQYAELTEAGYTGKAVPWDAFWGQRYAVVLDPDGNSAELFAPLTAAG